jgi:nucleoid-associated protein YgaU
MKVAKALQNALINNSPEVQQVVDQLKKLQLENATLKKKIAGGTTPAPVARPKQTLVQTKSPAKPAPKTTAPATESKHQIYHVVSGDTLSRIASKFYGDPAKWDAIFQANKDRMRTANDLREGQTLVIPALDN